MKRLKKTGKQNNKYTKEELIEAIQGFYKEFGRIPRSKDFEKMNGYPSRKTITNHFVTFNDAIEAAGFEPEHREVDKKYSSEEYLLGLIDSYMEEFQEQPTLSTISEYCDKKMRQYYRNVFGTWGNALEKRGMRAPASPHTDEFLESEFRRFIEQNKRIPKLHEFNASEYPSFWCYQDRFGSWNNAVVAYGYEPNDANRKHILENGEICASVYERDISVYLQEKKIPYERDVRYIDFTDGYDGKMNCDYKIVFKGKIWYVEMAGFMPRENLPWERLSSEEKMYARKLRYKIKLLKRQAVNYKIIYRVDIEEKTLDEIFAFLNE